MNKQKLAEIFTRFQQANPEPTTELIYHSPFELLIAVILSAQATEKLKDAIKTIGLFNTKAKNVLKTCQLLIEKHQSIVPQTREALEELPGVGRKTANVILNTVFKQPTMAVDTHIFRVSNRIGLAKGSTPLAVETKLVKVIPRQFLLDAHHWLILHGRYTCVARKPLCSTCMINDLCDYKLKTIED
jgi:endonuclease-3